jgi:hypothetical protein
MVSLRGHNGAYRKAAPYQVLLRTFFIVQNDPCNTRHDQACLFKAKYLLNALSALNKAGFRALFRRTSLASFLFGTVTLTGEAAMLKKNNYLFVNKAMLECLL